jgi:hypothetical protein
MTKRKLTYAAAVLVLITLACSFGSTATEEPAQPDPGPQFTMTAQALELEQLKAQSTADAEKAAQAQETANAQAAIDAQNTAAAAEVVQEPQATEEQVVEETEETITEEPEADAEMTELEQKMNYDLEFLYDQGVISEIKDEFIPFEDFNQEFAQLNYFTWWNTEFEPENFVIRADVKWNSASDIANWPFSGCGWVFGEADDENFHLVYLSLDGYGFFKKWVNGNEEVLVKHYIGPVSTPEGEAELILAVQDQRASLFVDGEEVFNTYDGNITPGTLSFSVHSGTNKGFGTRCEMTDIGLMVFE